MEVANGTDDVAVDELTLHPFLLGRRGEEADGDERGILVVPIALVGGDGDLVDAVASPVLVLHLAETGDAANERAVVDGEHDRSSLGQSLSCPCLAAASQGNGCL